MVQDSSLVTTAIASTDVVHIFFFDGGSRGNPGLSGARYVIVCLHIETETATVITAGTHYCDEMITNNVAWPGYTRLGKRLAVCLERKMEPLFVFGDSDNIVKRMQCYLWPRTLHLRPIYLSARVEADLLRIRG